MSLAAQPVAAIDLVPSSLEFFQSLMNGLQEAVWFIDARTLRVLAVNEASEAMFGLTRQKLIGKHIESLVNSPEDAMFWAAAAAGCHDAIFSDTWMRHADGHMLCVSRRASYVTQADGDGFWVLTWLDQTQQRQSDEARESLLAELRTTLESTADGILVTDLAGCARSFNRRFAAIWGFPEDLLLEKNHGLLPDWMSRNVVDSKLYAARLGAIEGAPQLPSQDVLTLSNGRVLERISLPQWSRGQAVGRVYSFRDLSEKLAADQRIEELSHMDSLTGLPNRRALIERIDYAQALAKRESTPFALLNVDIDRFKQINDTLGHAYGDRVLKEVAARLRDCLREVDAVARVSGDEFCVLVHQADVRGAELAACRIQEAMGQPFTFDTLSFTVTCSTGIALHPRDGGNAEALLASAERAMHWVKESGRGSYRFHLPRKDVDLLSRMRLDHAMRQALQLNQFRLHFQPQVDLHSNAVIGAEALIRWTDPLRGEVAPSDFIPVAEESGFIVSIGEWVLKQAVAQASLWLKRGWRMPVAVNVSALQFQQVHFVESVAQALQSGALPPELLELELTESILLHDADDALLRLRALADLGVCLSIDDFGTGFSSLGYLKRFPIQRLKIDRSFVTGLPADSSDAGIVNAVIQMGRALKLQVIAEGVETEAQRDFLARSGCHEYQGYLFAKVLDAASFEHRVWGAQGLNQRSPQLPMARLGRGGVGC